VLDVDVKQNRISLGMKQLEPNPYEQLTEKYPPGTVVKGHVRNIADFGIFVEIEEGIDGLVHISDMSWTQRSSTRASCSRRATRSRPCCSTLIPATATSRRSRWGSSSWSPIRGIGFRWSTDR